MCFLSLSLSQSPSVLSLCLDLLLSLALCRFSPLCLSRSLSLSVFPISPYIRPLIQNLLQIPLDPLKGSPLFGAPAGGRTERSSEGLAGAVLARMRCKTESAVELASWELGIGVYQGL